MSLDAVPTPFSHAILNNNLKLVSEFLSDPDFDVNQSILNGDQAPLGKTLLYTASQQGHLEIVTALLSHVKIAVNQSESALHVAVNKGHLGIMTALLSHPNPDINQSDKFDQSPLSHGSRLGHTDIVTALLSHPEIAVNQPEITD